MAKRPSFQFYPADWRNNAKLRRCSEAARGAWIDVLCLLHDSDEYGVLRWPLADIARATGLPLKLLKELADRDVLKGGDKGCDAYIHTPSHARKLGEPVVLLEKTDGPCWYSSRFLTDEWKRSVSGGDTKFKSPNDSPSRGKVNGEVAGSSSPGHSPDSRLGAGATSTSSSTTTNQRGGSNSESSLPNQVSPSAPPANQDSNQQTTAGEVCKAIKAMGISQVNPGNILLTTLIDAGATLEEFTGAAQAAVEKKKPNFSYVLGIVRSQREEAKAAAEVIATGSIKAAEKPWYITASGIEAEAKRRNLTIGRDEQIPQFMARVKREAGITAEMERKARLDFEVRA